MGLITICIWISCSWYFIFCCVTARSIRFKWRLIICCVQKPWRWRVWPSTAWTGKQRLMSLSVEVWRYVLEVSAIWSLKVSTMSSHERCTYTILSSIHPSNRCVICSCSPYGFYVRAEWSEESCVLARLWTFISFRPGLPGGHQKLSMCTPNWSREHSNS